MMKSERDAAGQHAEHIQGGAGGVVPGRMLTRIAQQFAHEGALSQQDRQDKTRRDRMTEQAEERDDDHLGRRHDHA